MTLSELEDVLDHLRRAVVAQYGMLCPIEGERSHEERFHPQKRISVAAAGAMNVCAIGHLPRDTPASDSAMYRATLELGLDQDQDAQMMHSAFEMLSSMATGREYAQGEIAQEFRVQLRVSEEQAIAVARAFIERYGKHMKLKP